VKLLVCKEVVRSAHSTNDYVDNKTTYREGAPSEEKVLEAKKKLEEYYDDPQYSSDQEDNHIFQQFVLTHRALFEEMDQYMVILSKRFGKYRDILCSSGLNN